MDTVYDILHTFVKTVANKVILVSSKGQGHFFLVHPWYVGRDKNVSERKKSRVWIEPTLHGAKVSVIYFK